MLGTTCLVISLFCYRFVVYKMYTEGDLIMLIISVGGLCIGIGGIVAFIYGWIKASPWEIKPVMLTWTAIWAVSFVLHVMAVVIA